jgi:hypothetical protein
VGKRALSAQLSRDITGREVKLFNRLNRKPFDTWKAINAYLTIYRSFTRLLLGHKFHFSLNPTYARKPHLSQTFKHIFLLFIRICPLFPLQDIYNVRIKENCCSWQLGFTTRTLFIQDAYIITPGSIYVYVKKVSHRNFVFKSGRCATQKIVLPPVLSNIK